MDTKTNRRLAAILATDVVDYTRFMSEDEIGTLRALKAQQEEVFVPRLAKFGGRVVKLMGDGSLIEFGSVVDAIEFSVDVQKTLAQRITEGSGTIHLVHRLGVSIGDVIVDDDDVHGAGVNLAARLEAVAPAGGIALSDNAWAQARGKVSVEFMDGGEQALKNIPGSVRVWYWHPERKALTGSALNMTVSGEPPLIAVLPFDNMSGDSEQDYFADGLVEDIITSLSHLYDVGVIARNSSFAFRGRSIDVKEIGRQLGARYVMEGSVRRIGDRLRLTAQLIDAETGNHIWAEKFDRDVSDIFLIQDEITEAVVAALLVPIVRNEARLSERLSPEQLSNLDLVYRGSVEFFRQTPDGFDVASDYLRKALQTDPENETALSYLAFIEFQRLNQGLSDDMAGAAVRCREYGERAVLARPDQARCHHALSLACILTGEWDQAIESAKIAVKLAPGNQWAWFGLGSAELLGGDPDAAIEPFRKSIQLSPLDPFTFFAENNRALAHYLRGRYEDANLGFQKSIALKPDFVFPRFNLAGSLAQLGREEEARSALTEAKRIQPEPGVQFFQFGWPFRDPENLEHVLAGQRKAGLKV